MDIRHAAGSTCVLLILGACASGGDHGTPGTKGASGTGGTGIINVPCGSGSTCGAENCGNGKLDPPSETCDDGNTEGGDGCSPVCTTETDWRCETPGEPCVYGVVCGDGIIAGAETCDDRNTTFGDGCDEGCHLEVGWVCPKEGAPCIPRCGDGTKHEREQCDDGNTAPGDGCSESCRFEPGFACPTEGSPCHATVCGDGVKEGSEACDDGNTHGGDGCGADCSAEPVCVGTDGCTSPCGDGLRLPGEECDDGNLTSGDGCSADCTLEPNWDCRDEGDADSGVLIVPVVYRDFLSQDQPNGHPNFGANVSGTTVPGMVKPILAADRKPVMADSPPANGSLTTADDFHEWYHDSPHGEVVHDTIELIQQEDGTFVYDHSEKWSDTDPVGWVTPPFFPLDDRGWAELPDGPERSYLADCDADGVPHNYGFTSEVRYWFEYNGGETLEFVGDDDVWVFVNGQLAVDLGGIHSAAAGSVTLDEAAAVEYGLTKGLIYEIVVFQAERRICGSSYKLTLGSFARTVTVCVPHCGDGIINGDEVCDDGINDGVYGGCMPGCLEFGPYCGDEVVESDLEECDDGRNVSVYNEPGCGPGCKNVPRCGDGQVDSLWGETCDDGNSESKDGCSKTCQVEHQIQ